MNTKLNYSIATNITLSWQAPLNNGNSDIISYDVYIINSLTGFPQMFNTRSMYFSRRPNVLNRRYFVYVRARNIFGAGISSVWLEVYIAGNSFLFFLVVSGFLFNKRIHEISLGSNYQSSWNFCYLCGRVRCKNS